MEKHNFTIEENQWRDRWKFWNITLPVALIFAVGVLILAFLGWPLFNGDYDSFIQQGTPLLINGITTLVASLAFLYAYYYSVYKHYDTKLLLATMIYIPFNFIIQSYHIFTIYGGVSRIVLIILGIIFSIWYFYLAYRMRKINGR